jgi:hypothetical protein
MKRRGRPKKSKLGEGKAEVYAMSNASPTLVKTARPMKCSACGLKKDVFRYEFIPHSNQWKKVCTNCLDKMKKEVDKLLGRKK